MVAVEGVARRLHPDVDLWATSRPIVERYLKRELSPLTRIRGHIEEIARAARAIVEMAEREPAPAVVIQQTRGSPLAWFLAGAALAALISLVTVLAVTHF